MDGADAGWQMGEVGAVRREEGADGDGGERGGGGGGRGEEEGQREGEGAGRDEAEAAATEDGTSQVAAPETAAATGAGATRWGAVMFVCWATFIGAFSRLGSDEGHCYSALQACC